MMNSEARNTQKIIVMLSGSRIWRGDNALAVLRDKLDAFFCRAADSPQIAKMIFGDAVGADKIFAELAELYSIRYEVYGIQSASRNGAENFVNCKSATCYTYKQRDQLMLAKADMLFAFWNGESKGTKAIYEDSLKSSHILKSKLFKIHTNT
jgi:hypothetical protein